MNDPWSAVIALANVALVLFAAVSAIAAWRAATASRRAAEETRDSRLDEFMPVLHVEWHSQKTDFSLHIRLSNRGKGTMYNLSLPRLPGAVFQKDTVAINEGIDCYVLGADWMTLPRGEERLVFRYTDVYDRNFEASVRIAREPGAAVVISSLAVVKLKQSS